VPRNSSNEEPVLWNVRNLFGELSGISCAIASPVPSREMRSGSCGLHECRNWSWRPEQDHGSSASKSNAEG
jgi:hypothetical protein